MIRKLILGAVILALVAAGFTWGTSGSPQRRVRATFASAVSLYPGAAVKVLGVPVGHVTAITVQGPGVAVDITYRADVQLPADVHAMIIPPSIVGDRYVQLSPAYVSGPVLADGAALDLSHTGVPMELDDNYRALDKLARALGPRGVNDRGALSRLVTETARALSGQGRNFNQAIRNLADALATLDDSSTNANATVSHLAVLAKTFEGNDDAVRRLVDLTARVGAELSQQRSGITTAVSTLRSALADVSDLITVNRPALSSTIADLSKVTQQLSRHADELGTGLALAPVGLTSLGNIYVPQNWDPTKPWATPIDGREGSLALHNPQLMYLNQQLGYALTAMCAQMSPAQAAQLSGLCSALASTGGSLGSLLTGLAVPPSGGAPSSLAGLLGGAS